MSSTKNVIRRNISDLIIFLIRVLRLNRLVEQHVSVGERIKEVAYGCKKGRRTQ